MKKIIATELCEIRLIWLSKSIVIYKWSDSYMPPKGFRSGSIQSLTILDLIRISFPNTTWGRSWSASI